MEENNQERMEKPEQEIENKVNEVFCTNWKCINKTIRVVTLEGDKITEEEFVPTELNK